MKLYTLCIMFDPDNDEVEFIEETIDDLDSEQDFEIIYNGTDLLDYMDDKTIKMLFDTKAYVLGIT